MAQKISYFAIILVALVAVCYSSNSIECRTNLAPVKLKIDSLLAGWGLPEVAYDCVGNDNNLNITLTVNDFEILSFSSDQYNNNTLLSQAAETIILTVRGTYIGVSGTSNDHSNSRHSNSPFINSNTVGDLKLKCLVDLSPLVSGFDDSQTLTARFNGPLSPGQCTVELCFGTAGGLGWTHYEDFYETAINHPLRDGRLVAFNRTVNGTHDPATTNGLILPKCDILWSIKWSDISTQGTRLIAALNPTRYNVTRVNSWTRATNFGGSFAPISLTADGLLITGDNSPAYYFETANYLAGIPHPQYPEIKGYPQANATVLPNGTLVLCSNPAVNCSQLEITRIPIIKENHSVDNQNRHHLCGNGYVIDAKTGQLKTAFIFADTGKGSRADPLNPFADSDLGFVQKYAGLRRVEVAQCHNRPYRIAIASSSFMDTVNSEAWMRTDGDAIRIQAALLTGNAHFRKNRFTVYKLWNNASGVKLEHWQHHYNVPRWNYAGDVNPYNTSHIFASDTEAQEANYRADGFWSHGIWVNETDCTIVVAASNGHGMPKQVSIAASHAVAPVDDKGGRCLARQSGYQFRYDLANVYNKNAALLQKWGNDKHATAKCRMDKIRQLPTFNTYDKYYLANGWFKFNLDSGKVVADQRNQPFDTFVASWQWFVPQADLPLSSQYDLFTEGFDSDAHAVVHVPSKDLFAAFRKDGSFVTLNTQNLNVQCHLQLALPTSGGSTNYGMTLVDDNLAFIALMNNDAFGPAFGNPMHNTTLDNNDVPVINYPDPSADGLFTATYPSDVSLDPHMPRVRNFDQRAILLARVDISKCAITGVVTLSTAEDDPQDGQYTPFSVQVSSNNDVVCAAGAFSSKFRCYNPYSMNVLWERDTFALLNSTTNLPPYRSMIFLNGIPTIVGNEVITAETEGFFSGVTPGRWVAVSSVSYPARKQGNSKRGN